MLSLMKIVTNNNIATFYFRMFQLEEKLGKLQHLPSSITFKKEILSKSIIASENGNDAGNHSILLGILRSVA